MILDLHGFVVEPGELTARTAADGSAVIVFLRVVFGATNVVILALIAPQIVVHDCRVAVQVFDDDVAARGGRMRSGERVSDSCDDHSRVWPRETLHMHACRHALWLVRY